MAGTYLLHQQNRGAKRTDSAALFDRVRLMRLRLRSAAAMLSLSDNGSTQDFNEKMRVLKARLPLPVFLHDKTIAPALAAYVKDIFRQSAFGAHTSHMHDLDDRQFDQLLFTASISAYGSSQHVFKSKDALMKTSVAFEDLPPVDELVTTYGVEQEFFNFNDAQPLSHAMQYFDPSWILTTDATIDTGETFSEGLELISPILDRSNMHRLLFFAHLLEAEKAKSSRHHKCALHVHAGIKNTFHDKGFQLRLIKQMVINYAEIDQDISFLNSYMTAPYCAHDAAKKPFMESVLQGGFDDLPVNGTQISPTFQPHGRRFSRINFLSLHNYGTAEFRHHPGTVNPRDIAHWVHFVNDFMRASVNMVSGQEAHIPSGGEAEKLHDIAASFTRKTGMRHQIC